MTPPPTTTTATATTAATGGRDVDVERGASARW